MAVVDTSLDNLYSGCRILVSFVTRMECCFRAKQKQRFFMASMASAHGNHVVDFKLAWNQGRTSMFEKP